MAKQDKCSMLESRGPPILYVEDDEETVFLVQYGLARARVKHPLKVLANGRRAVDYLMGSAPYQNRWEYPLPFLLLLDVDLPIMSGMEVLCWIRRQSAFRDLPVIVLSGSEQSEERKRILEFGANDYLIKPSDSDTYIEFVAGINERWLNKPVA